MVIQLAGASIQIKNECRLISCSGLCAKC